MSETLNNAAGYSTSAADLGIDEQNPLSIQAQRDAYSPPVLQEGDARTHHSVSISRDGRNGAHITATSLVGIGQVDAAANNSTRVETRDRPDPFDDALFTSSERNEWLETAAPDFSGITVPLQVSDHVQLLAGVDPFNLDNSSVRVVAQWGAPPRPAQDVITEPVAEQVAAVWDTIIPAAKAEQSVRRYMDAQREREEAVADGAEVTPDGNEAEQPRQTAELEQEERLELEHLLPDEHIGAPLPTPEVKLHAAQTKNVPTPG